DRVRSGSVNTVHQPVLATSPSGRNEVTSSPKVGIVHTTLSRMTRKLAIGLLKDRRIALTAGSCRFLTGCALVASTAPTLIGSHAPFVAARCCSRRAAG